MALAYVHKYYYITFIHRQCTDKDAIQLRNKCNVDVKNLLSLCLNETEIAAFIKIEVIAQRLYDVICRIDKEKMKRETMDMLKIEHLSSWNCVLQIADFFSTKGQECLVDNVITVGFCFLQAIPEDLQAKQELLFKLIDGKECK